MEYCTVHLVYLATEDQIADTRIVQRPTPQMFHSMPSPQGWSLLDSSDLGNRSLYLSQVSRYFTFVFIIPIAFVSL